jgi:arylsulfatase
MARLTWLSLAVASASCGDAPREPRARNAILITCDTLRADRLGVYGYRWPTSPEIDRFAKDCVVFDNAYACAPWTQPALSSLMSGHPPEEIGVSPGNTRRMDGKVQTLAELLESQGFATAACVSNGLLRKLPPDSSTIGLEQGFESFDVRMTVREKNREAYERPATATTDAAMEWLAGRPRDRRFFLWVHYQDPHGPYTPPPEIARDLDRPASDETLPIGHTQRGLGQIPQYQNLSDERRPDVYRARYDGEIRYFDREFGRLIQALTAEGVLADTLVIVTADHGESLGEHGQYFCHGENVSREVVHVPLIVRLPGTGPTRAGDVGTPVRSDTVVGHLDVAPTILAALDIAQPAGWRGTSLLAPEQLPRQRTLVQSFVARRPGVDEWAITDGRWRLVWRERSTARLYDVSADPGETRDLAASEPEVVARLKHAYEEYRTSLRSGSAGVDAVLDAEGSKGLEALGYAESNER